MRTTGVVHPKRKKQRRRCNTPPKKRTHPTQREPLTTNIIIIIIILGMGLRKASAGEMRCRTIEMYPPRVLIFGPKSSATHVPRLSPIILIRTPLIKNASGTSTLESFRGTGRGSIEHRAGVETQTPIRLDTRHSALGTAHLIVARHSNPRGLLACSYLGRVYKVVSC